MGLTDEQFWNLTPPQFAALSDRLDATIQLEDYRAGIVASTIANCHKDSKSKPFSPKDFMPRYGEEKKEEKYLTKPDDMLQHLKNVYPPNKKSKKKGRA